MLLMPPQHHIPDPMIRVALQLEVYIPVGTAEELQQEDKKAISKMWELINEEGLLNVIDGYFRIVGSTAIPPRMRFNGYDG